jgi:hypothetical protein
VADPESGASRGAGDESVVSERESIGKRERARDSLEREYSDFGFCNFKRIRERNGRGFNFFRVKNLSLGIVSWRNYSVHQVNHVIRPPFQ